jgi:hypothetical protein
MLVVDVLFDVLLRASSRVGGSNSSGISHFFSNSFSSSCFFSRASLVALRSADSLKRNLKRFLSIRRERGPRLSRMEIFHRPNRESTLRLS